MSKKAKKVYKDIQKFEGKVVKERYGNSYIIDKILLREDYVYTYFK